MQSGVVGRFAPSPTGRMHLGNVFCALLVWLVAKHTGGKMILRMEDLDIARCKPEDGEQLLRDLAWLGLTWDEGGNAQRISPKQPHNCLRSSAGADL